MTMVLMIQSLSIVFSIALRVISEPIAASRNIESKLYQL